jgi:hypothetical protein
LGVLKLTIEMPASLDDGSKAVTLLTSFTPLDASVLATLDSAVRAEHLADLLKKLYVTAEVTAPGRGADSIRALVDKGRTADEIIRNIDAILEFGVAFDDLAADEAEKALRAEIRQEILHFDRIMDLESLTGSRTALKKRREFVHQSGLLGSAERLLVLVQERLLLRSARAFEWRDMKSVPQRLSSVVGSGARFMRTQHPHAVGVAKGATHEDSKSFVEAIERLILRHPLPVAVALADYELFLDRAAPVDASIATFSVDEAGAVTADVWSAGTTSWMLIRREGFNQVLIDHGDQTSVPLGETKSQYSRLTIGLPADTWLVLVAGDLKSSSHAELAAAVNRSGPSGRTEVVANLNLLLGDTPFVVAKPGAFQVPAAPTVSDYTPNIADFAASAFRDSAALHLSIECGHIHADREVGTTQLRGLDLGAEVVAALRAESAANGLPLQLDVTPMVDDDHVLNRFSFGEYREMFRARGMDVDDLILESSPLPRAIAHDVLRVAIAGDGHGYQLQQIGNNLYLEAEGFRVELVEDLEGEMRNGCIMFEVGLVMYRATRSISQAVYWDSIGAPDRDLHAEMAESYDQAPDPVVRAAIRSQYERMYRDPWSSVVTSVSHTPFMDAYRAEMDRRRAEGERTVVFNVLEDYYSPQQVKVQRLAQLVGVELPMRSMFFSPYARGIRLVDFSTPVSAS